MKKEKLHYLLYRAAAALETSPDTDKKELAAELAKRAQEIEETYEGLNAMPTLSG